MKHQLRLGIVAVSVLALTGCGKDGTGVGVSAKSEQSSAVEEKSSIAREKSIQAQDTSKKVVTVPAAGLLANAVVALPRDCPANLDEGGCLAYRRIIDAVSFSTKPCLGWPGDLESGKNRRFAADASEQKLPQAIEIMRILASKLGKQTMRDPDDLKARVQEMVRTSPIDIYRAATDAAGARFKEAAEDAAAISLNYTGRSKYPVEFAHGRYTFGCDQAGWHVVKFGIPWFGDGAIAGEKVEVALESTLSTGMTKKTDISGSTTENASTANTADVGVKQ
jgi:hypothetical protein